MVVEGLRHAASVEAVMGPSPLSDQHCRVSRSYWKLVQRQRRGLHFILDTIRCPETYFSSFGQSSRVNP